MKDNYPKISVVTPSFNSAKYIEDCIQSVLNQNYPNFEHIVIDGGSTDGTVDILKQYHHLKWISEPDKGQSDALNKGIIMANGEYILWLNADDYLEKYYLNKFIDKLKKKKKFDICYGHMRLVNEKKEEIRKIAQIDWFYLLSLLRVYFPPSSGTIFKREILRNNLFNLNFHYNMDGEWFLRAGKNLKTYVINDITINFRVTDTSKTGKSIKYKKYNEQQIKEKRILSEQYYCCGRKIDLFLKNIFKIYVYKKKIKYIKYYYENITLFNR